MHAGEIMQVGAPRRGYARPVNKIVADFMGLVNLISARSSARAATTASLAVGGEHPINAALPPDVVAARRCKWRFARRTFGCFRRRLPTARARFRATSPR